MDDLRHAALNGHGSFINANDSTQFASGIADALNRIGERRGSASNVLANSTSISTESFVYQATYTAGSWRGELLAYPISSAGLGAPQWRAGEHIALWSSRKIFTTDSSGAASTFPSTTQSTTLGTAATALGLASATALSDYLKGDAIKEKRNGGLLRDRTMRNAADQVVPALLGDIVDSSPFYVADSQTVFVGANDGMLHAIDASNTTANTTNTSGGGTERFTYIPRGVAMDQLAGLADPSYGTNHHQAAPFLRGRAARGVDPGAHAWQELPDRRLGSWRAAACTDSTSPTRLPSPLPMSCGTRPVTPRYDEHGQRDFRTADFQIEHPGRHGSRGGQWS